MKILIGWAEQLYGTVTLTPRGELALEGDEEMLTYLLEDYRSAPDLESEGRRVLSNAELLPSLLQRMRGYLWAGEVADDYVLPADRKGAYVSPMYHAGVR